MEGLLGVLGVKDITILFSFVMAFIGACAFVVSLATEALKSVESINKAPTKLVCYITALILTPLIYVGIMAYMKRPIEWFEVFGSFLAAFVVAKVSMGGWDDVTEIFDKMIKHKKG